MYGGTNSHMDTAGRRTFDSGGCGRGREEF